ncbi:MAG: sulfatase-like hydrolase/transferase [Lentisphaerales bacterium]|nr:sulfatase-like hydrolase/transferase [Lentisphaerales bacterium]
MFTGLHPAKTGALANSHSGRPWKSYVAGAATLPKYLSKYGWKSFGIGKNFHNKDKGEFDIYYGRAKEIKATKKSFVKLNPSGTWGVATVPTSKMPDYISVSQGIKALESTSESLFLSLGIYRPHVPWIVPQKYFDMYPLNSLQMPKTIPNDLEDLPVRFQRIAHNDAKFGPGYHKKLVKTGNDRQKVRAYLASLTFADEQVGRILDAWYASPHSKNGYVILWSDHGYQLSEKEGWSKMKPWFDSARVNLMIAGPGLTEGEFCDKAVSLIDLYPTLVDLLKLPQPSQKLHGKSLVPLLKNPQMEWDKPVLMSSELDGCRYDTVMANNYRMTRLVTGETELYKLAEDPHEFNNIAAQAESKEVIEKLERYLSFNYPVIENQRWLEAHDIPSQISSDFGQRGNFHYPESQADASEGGLMCAVLRKGVGSYLEFVIKVDEPGDYQLKISLNAQGPLTLFTAPVVNDATQADAGYSMSKVQKIGKSKSSTLESVAIKKLSFKQSGLHLLRFSSELKSQKLKIDRLLFRKIE